jgi:hypothetical protein
LEKRDEIFEVRLLRENMTLQERIKNLSERNEFEETDDSKHAKRSWRGEPIRSSYFFNESDKSTKFFTQKAKLFKWFTNSNNDKLRIFKEKEDDDINQVDDKNIITKTTPDQLFFLYYDAKKKTSFRELVDWTKGKLKTVIICILEISKCK